MNQGYDGSRGRYMGPSPVLEDGQRGAEAVNTHVCRASRLIYVAPENDIVSRRFLHSDIGDAAVFRDA